MKIYKKNLNDPVNFEFYSSYTYLAMKLYDYVYRKNASIELEQIDTPQPTFYVIIDLFQK